MLRIDLKKDLRSISHPVTRSALSTGTGDLQRAVEEAERDVAAGYSIESSKIIERLKHWAADEA